MRNAHRINERNIHDRKLMSKCCLPNILSCVFGPSHSTPDDELFTPPNWLLQAITIVANINTQMPAVPSFQCWTNDSSVIHNTNLLENYNYNFTKFIDNNQHTSIYYSSEFRPLSYLSLIYYQRDLFPFFKGLHQNGMEYIYNRKLSDCKRLAELEANITRGNHRLATERPTELVKMLNRKVEFGFSVLV